MKKKLLKSEKTKLNITFETKKGFLFNPCSPNLSPQKVKIINWNNKKSYSSEKFKKEKTNKSSQFIENSYITNRIQTREKSYDNNHNNSIQEKKKLNHLFRRGISQNELYDILENRSNKLKYPLLQNKKKIPIFLQKNKEKSNNPIVKQIDEHRIRNISNNIQNLNREIIVKSKAPIKLTEVKNFHPKFQFVNDLINLDRDEQLKKMINDLIEKKFKLKKEISNIIKKNNIEINNDKRKLILQKWKRVIILCAIDFQNLNISIRDFHNKKLIPDIHFDRNIFSKFINFIKEKNIIQTKEMLKMHSCLSNYFDEFGQTALHFVAKRNLDFFVPFLVKKGARVNSQDYIGRTPLHVACKYNALQTVKALLFEFADPMKTDKSGKFPREITKNEEIRRILKYCSSLHILFDLGRSMKNSLKIRIALEYIFQSNLIID